MVNQIMNQGVGTPLLPAPTLPSTSFVGEGGIYTPALIFSRLTQELDRTGGVGSIPISVLDYMNLLCLILCCPCSSLTLLHDPLQKAHLSSIPSLNDSTGF